MKEYWNNRIKIMVEEYHRSDDPAKRLSLMLSIQIAIKIAISEN